MTVGLSTSLLAGRTPSLASQLPQCPQRAWNLGKHANPVGVSLLAMASVQPTSFLTVPPLSRAGSLLPGFGLVRGLRFGHKNCGSSLASDDGGSIDIVAGWADAFAGKPAPTVSAACVEPGQTRNPCRSEPARDGVRPATFFFLTVPPQSRAGSLLQGFGLVRGLWFGAKKVSDVVKGCFAGVG